MGTFRAERLDTAMPRLALAGWVLFDWAAQPFFSLIQSFGYAPYFVNAMVGDPIHGQAYWGYGTAVAALLIALLSPPLGAVADQVGRCILSVGPGHIGPWQVEPPHPGGALFASPAEYAYLSAGALIGLSFGILLASTRVILIRLCPPDRLTQFFGLFALSGRITAFLGPLSVALVTHMMQSQRTGIAVLMLFFGAGLALLATVRTR